MFTVLFSSITKYCSKNTTLHQAKDTSMTSANEPDSLYIWITCWLVTKMAQKHWVFIFWILYIWTIVFPDRRLHFWCSSLCHGEERKLCRLLLAQFVLVYLKITCSDQKCCLILLHLHVSNTQPVQIRAERNAIYIKHPSHYSGSANSRAAAGFI